MVQLCGAAVFPAAEHGAELGPDGQPVTLKREGAEDRQLAHRAVDAGLVGAGQRADNQDVEEEHRNLEGGLEGTRSGEAPEFGGKPSGPGAQYAPPAAVYALPAVAGFVRGTRGRRDRIKDDGKLDGGVQVGGGQEPGGDASACARLALGPAGSSAGPRDRPAGRVAAS